MSRSRMVLTRGVVMEMVRSKAEAELLVSAGVVRTAWKPFRAAVFACRVEN